MNFLSGDDHPSRFEISFVDTNAISSPYRFSCEDPTSHHDTFVCENGPSRSDCRRPERGRSNVSFGNNLFFADERLLCRDVLSDFDATIGGILEPFQGISGLNLLQHQDR